MIWGVASQHLDTDTSAFDVAGFWVFLLVAMDLRTLFLDPSKTFLERSLNPSFYAVNLVLRYPFLPLRFRIAESPRHFTRLSWIRWVSRTPTVAFAAHNLHLTATSVRTVTRTMTRPVTLHVPSRKGKRVQWLLLEKRWWEVTLGFGTFEKQF